MNKPSNISEWKKCFSFFPTRVNDDIIWLQHFFELYENGMPTGYRYRTWEET